MKLLVPTNFSASSDAAVNFAAGLVLSSQDAIHFVHVVEPFVQDVSFAPVNTVSCEENSVMLVFTCQSALWKKYKIKSSSYVAFGKVADEILNAAKIENSDLIIMGASDTVVLKSFALESFTASVIERSVKPVVVVPRKASPFSPKKIVYTLDYHSINLDDLKKLAEVAEYLNAEVITIPMAQGGKSAISDVEIRQQVGDFIHQNIPFDRISCRTFQEIKTEEGLKLYLQEEGADMLAVSMQDGSFDKLFSKKLTNEVAFDANIPMLIFPDRKNSKTNNHSPIK